MPRIAIGGSLCETNTFVPSPAIFSYFDGGSGAGRVLAAMLDGTRPEKAFLRAPYLSAIAWQTWSEPARGLYQRLEEIAGDVTALSFNMGFPAADFPDCSMSVLAYCPSAEPAARV
jgi:microcystin degradation protein MlrC